MSKLLFLGDLFYDYKETKQDIEKISNFIKQNNYKTIVNLEGTLYKDNKKIKKRGPNLYQNIITIEVLKKLNVVGVCLANNHTMDYGDNSLNRTIQLLIENNIKYCGAGSNLQEALKPMDLNLDGKSIKIFNYGWNVEETVYAKSAQFGCSPRIEKYIINNTKNSEADLLINIMHWGFEYNLYPLPLDIKLAHKMIDNGANLIIGHHPHVIQPKETYKQKNIYYSLGNFYFSSRRDKFSEKKFKGTVNNKCNYGLGVVYDTKQEIVEKELLFYYDSKSKQTEILKSNNSLSILLPDISNFQYTKKEYYNLAKNNKAKLNPILTGNKIIDKCKILILYMLYLIKNLIKI